MRPCACRTSPCTLTDCHLLQSWCADAGAAVLPPTAGLLSPSWARVRRRARTRTRRRACTRTPSSFLRHPSVRLKRTAQLGSTRACTPGRKHTNVGVDLLHCAPRSFDGLPAISGRRCCGCRELISFPLARPPSDLRANSKVREPQLQKWWEENKVYQRCVWPEVASQATSAMSVANRGVATRPRCLSLH